MRFDFRYLKKQVTTKKHYKRYKIHMDFTTNTFLNALQLTYYLRNTYVYLCPLRGIFLSSFNLNLTPNFRNNHSLNQIHLIQVRPYTISAMSHHLSNGLSFHTDGRFLNLDGKKTCLKKTGATGSAQKQQFCIKNLSYQSLNHILTLLILMS